ncbi:anti-sigma factor [Mesonia maritima]|uniref:Anti-sigma-K factor RskA n=1 Tax=Mesonia maritima TaxID=1793873 RepID=A0ABU1K5E8_9FLAO|nr:anti-sigma factor [Mesonia maritima]MDR6300840.1 anti-sigma-K factor RskA [Mesonia maritima]
MKNIQQYIDSGILELYIYGALSEEESKAVSAELKKYPEIKKEVEEIEKALESLASAVAPYNPEELFKTIQTKVENATGTIPIHRKSKKRQIVLYIGWAASILLLIGLFTVLNENRELRDALRSSKAQNALVEQEIENAREDAAQAQELLNVYRDRNIVKIPLGGQQVAPNAYAEVHWDKKDNKVYIDAKDLPTPPEGKEYQVWSLTLDPLSPTSIGLLSNFKEDDNKIFILENPNSSQAFGITLEPKGGSKTPTMEQLYTLGKV